MFDVILRLNVKIVFMRKPRSTYAIYEYGLSLPLIL